MRAMRWWSGCGIVVLSTVLGCGGSSDSKDPTLVDVWFVQKIKVGGAELAGVDGFFQVRQNRSVRGFLAYETTVGTATVARSADFTGSLKASDGNLELNLKADRTQDEVVLSDLQLTTEGATRTYQVSEVGKTLSFKIEAGSVSVELEFLGLLGTWTLSALVETRLSYYPNGSDIDKDALAEAIAKILTLTAYTELEDHFLDGIAQLEGHVVITPVVEQSGR